MPDDMSVTDLIRQQLGALTPSERRVARAIAAGPPTAGLESSSRLAARAGVSGPTVSRFVQRLGYANYAAFQTALHGDIADRVMSPVEVYRRHEAQLHEAQRADFDGPGEAGRALSEAVAATLAELPRADLDRATALLADRRRPVLAAGGWFSHLLADYLVALLREFRPGVRAVPPHASERATAIADVARKDVVVVFDFRRYEQDTIAFARAVHEAGARVVLFTDPWLSPIAELADATLPARVIGPAPFETLTPTCALVETLMTGVAHALDSDGRQRFERFGAIVDGWVRPWPG